MAEGCTQTTNDRVDPRTGIAHSWHLDSLSGLSDVKALLWRPLPREMTLRAEWAGTLLR